MPGALRLSEEPAARPARLAVQRVEAHHAAALAEFIRLVWDPAATSEGVLAARAEAAARNVAEPGVPPPTWIAIQSGKVLGYVTTIPIRIQDGASEQPGYWIKGLMVHPEFRNGPIGYSVLKAAVAALPRTAALAVAAPARRLFEALGYTDLGAVPNWIRPMAPDRILTRLDFEGLGLAGMPSWTGRALKFVRAIGLTTVLGWAGSSLLRASAAGLRLRAATLRSESYSATLPAAEIDGLWHALASRFPRAVVRDSQFLLPRYPMGGSDPYAWIGVRDSHGLLGWAVLRRPRADGDPRLRGIRVATLADMLYAPDRPAVGLALLGGVERAARSFGADAILASCPAPALQSLLRRQWYLPLAGNVHFLLRDVTANGLGSGGALADWWLQRGDGSADEVF